jgi:D-alanyl-D-alanine carboxypeptidase/D-alanyl-D-alanine-endopeptidase (penicillin-binding protein 4)
MADRKYNPALNTVKIILLSLLLVAGCSLRPSLLQEGGNRRLIRELNTVIREAGLDSNLGIKVVALESGETIYSHNAKSRFNPASNNKLYTSLAALKLLTPQFRFETSIWADSLEWLKGQLSHFTLKGGGDPDFSLPELQELVRKVALKIDGIDTLFVDPFIFDTIPQGNGWMWDEGDGWYAASVSGLNLNDNCVQLNLRPGTTGKPPLLNLYPPTAYVTVNNEALTLADTTGHPRLTVARRWETHSNIIDIKGALLPTSPELTRIRNIEDPALYTGTVFKELLEAADVKVAGPVLKGAVPPSDVKVLAHLSPFLTESNLNLMKTSDNLTAEVFVKTIGHVTTGQTGSWTNGLAAMKTFLADSVGIDTTTLSLADGSGVSRYNYSSPDHLVQLLAYAYRDYSINAEFLAALPTGGWDGTLRKRLRDREVNRRIRAKTGTLSGVSCLSGYIFTKYQGPLAFSILMNGYVGDAKPYQSLQDKICTVLVNFQ